VGKTVLISPEPMRKVLGDISLNPATKITRKTRTQQIESEIFSRSSAFSPVRTRRGAKHINSSLGNENKTYNTTSVNSAMVNKHSRCEGTESKKKYVKISATNENKTLVAMSTLADSKSSFPCNDKGNAPCETIDSLRDAVGKLKVVDLRNELSSLGIEPKAYRKLRKAELVTMVTQERLNRLKVFE
jgi:hypothetical protein